MTCRSCGREMTRLNGAYLCCVNLHCPTRFQRGRAGPPANTAELTPSVARDGDSRRGAYVGRVYVKETRIVNDCDCQGVSFSTVAIGDDRREVRERTFSEAAARAQQYAARGYRVTLKRVA